jgi:sensor domain CHASE-containing protein
VNGLIALVDRPCKTDAPKKSPWARFLEGVAIGREKAREREQQNLNTSLLNHQPTVISALPTYAGTGDKHETPYPAPNELREQGRL